MPTPSFVSKSMVLSIHAGQIERFGGTPGVRDEGLLESALAQQQATFGCQFLHPTISEQAAAYLYHIAMNHIKSVSIGIVNSSSLLTVHGVDCSLFTASTVNSQPSTVNIIPV